jgi:putative transposase
LIASQAGKLPVKLMCRVAGVSRSGYYAARRRPESLRAMENRRLVAQIEAIHGEDHKDSYGSRRMHVELVARGLRCDRHRVERLMRRHGIRAARRPPAVRRHEDDAPEQETLVPDLLCRDFAVALPNRVWLGDITQFATREGVLYLAFLLDLCSRMIVGWAGGATKDRWLTIGVLEMALGWRQPPKELIHHTDQGGQYACADYAAVLREHGALVSMSRAGTPLDNAPMESFIKTFKVEFVRLHSFDTRKEALTEAGKYLQLFYNCERRHSALGYLSPAEYEKQLKTHA